MERGFAITEISGIRIDGQVFKWTSDGSNSNSSPLTPYLKTRA